MRFFAALPQHLPAFALAAGLLGLVVGCGHEAAPPRAAESAGPTGNVIVIAAEQADRLDIETAAAVRDVFHFELPIPGIVMPAPDHEMIVSAPVDGRIARLLVQEGDRVDRGDALVEIESLTIGNLVADYIQARADALYMGQRADRLATLQDRGVGSLRELERTRADAQRADASHRAARSRLVAIGFTDGDMDAWTADSPIVPRLTVRAGIEGVVSRSVATLGGAVDVHEQLFAIVDPSHVLVRGFLAPQDLPLVSAGSDVTVYRDETSDGASLSGPIVNINPTLDDLNRAATVNAILATAEGWPVPGQNLRVQVAAATPTPVLHVPLAAVVFEGESAVVYVSLGDDRYEKRRVEISRMTSDAAIISTGLVAGEMVAVSNVFALKALGRLEQYGEE
ncbi:MAG: efflux RND transporter periplasmic adaptor subunit [Candidatus Krumholzibacteriia bacterium]